VPTIAQVRAQRKCSDGATAANVACAPRLDSYLQLPAQLQRRPQGIVHARLPTCPGCPQGRRQIGASRSFTATLVTFAFGWPRPRLISVPPWYSSARSKNASVSSGASSGSTRFLRVAHVFAVIVMARLSGPNSISARFVVHPVIQLSNAAAGNRHAPIRTLGCERVCGGGLQIALREFQQRRLGACRAPPVGLQQARLI